MSLFKHKIKEVISPENLVGKQSYLSKNAELKSNIKYKEYNNLINLFKNELSKIRWEDITFSNKIKMDRFKVILPKYLEDLKQNIITLGITLDDLDLLNFYESEWNFYFEIDSINDKNRIHYPSSLPKELKRIGFGYKMYKALSMFLGYISSAPSASPEAEWVWTKLITEDNDFNAMSSFIFSVIIRKDLPTNEKKEIVSNFVGSLDNIRNNKFTVAIDDDLIKELNLEKNGN